MVNGVDQERQAENVRKKDEFLAHIGAYLPNLCQELDSRLPFIRAEACLASKVVQVRDQPFHQETKACVITR